jgi:phage tail sheath protein FI
MPVTPTYPGVYVQELASGARPITGVATAIAAFVDWFPRGRVNDAVLCSSFADFEREFGGIHLWSEASYAIDQFFRNGGQSAYVVRVVTSTASPATTAIKSGVANNAQTALTLTAISQGTWGNTLRARVDPGVDGTHYDLTVYTYSLDGERQAVLSEEVFRNVSSAAADSRFVERVVRDESSLVKAKADLTTPPLVNGTPGADLAVPPPNPPPPPMIAATNPPTHRFVTVWLGTVNGGVTALAPEVDLGDDELRTPEEVANRLQDAIRQFRPTEAAFAGATVRVVPVVVAGVEKLRFHISAGVGSDPTPRFELTDAASGPNIATALGLAGAVSNVATYQFGTTTSAKAQAGSTKGADGGQPKQVELIGSEAVVPATGMYALNGADLFNLLCLPRVSKDEDTNPLHGSKFDFAAQGISTLSPATQYCERRRAILLVDPPATVRTVPQAKQFLLTNASLRHPNVAWYWPRVQINDPLDEFRPRSIGNSGTVAGLCARTDSARGVWKAPAGTEATLRGLTKLDYKMTDAENGQLNPLALNCLRTFDLYGHVNWGGRTSVGQDANPNDWRYLPVRRLALFIEETLFRSTTWVIFEPNDEPLWGQIRLAVGAFMNDLFRKGAFQGRTKQEAYFVRCDSTTTTPQDQANGIVNLVVGFAPLKPAEFLIITITQIPPQLEV